MSAGIFLKLKMTWTGERYDSQTCSWFDDNGTVLNWTLRAIDWFFVRYFQIVRTGNVSSTWFRDFNDSCGNYVGKNWLANCVTFPRKADHNIATSYDCKRTLHNIKKE